MLRSQLAGGAGCVVSGKQDYHNVWQQGVVSGKHDYHIWHQRVVSGKQDNHNVWQQTWYLDVWQQNMIIIISGKKTRSS